MTEKTPSEMNLKRAKYVEERRCCTICNEKNRCHICKIQTLQACSDCRIDLNVTVYVCEKKECRDFHESKCSYWLREALRAERESERKRVLESEQVVGIKSRLEFYLSLIPGIAGLSDDEYFKTLEGKISKDAISAFQSFKEQAGK